MDGKRESRQKNRRGRPETRFEQTLENDAKDQLFGQRRGDDGGHGNADDDCLVAGLDEFQVGMLRLWPANRGHRRQNGDHHRHDNEKTQAAETDFGSPSAAINSVIGEPIASRDSQEGDHDTHDDKVRGDRPNDARVGVLFGAVLTHGQLNHSRKDEHQQKKDSDRHDVPLDHHGSPWLGRRDHLLHDECTSHLSQNEEQAEKQER